MIVISCLSKKEDIYLIHHYSTLRIFAARSNINPIVIFNECYLRGRKRQEIWDPKIFFQGNIAIWKKQAKLLLLTPLLGLRCTEFIIPIFYTSSFMHIFYPLIFSWHFYLDHIDAKTFISFHKRHSCFGLLRYGVVKFSFHNIWGVLQWKLYETCVAKHRIIYTILQLCPSVGQICHDNVILF